MLDEGYNVLSLINSMSAWSFLASEPAREYTGLYFHTNMVNTPSTLYSHSYCTITSNGSPSPPIFCSFPFKNFQNTYFDVNMLSVHQYVDLSKY